MDLSLGMGLSGGGALFPFDASAKTFFQAVTDAGGSLTSIERDAINVYVLDAKNNANTWWTDDVADYPMVGGTAASCAVNLKNPGTFDITWVNTVAGDFTATGWTPNGTTSYGKTGLIPSVILGDNSGSLGYYSRTNIVEQAMEMGVYSTAAVQLFTLWLDRLGNNSDFYYSSAAAGQYARTTVAGSAGGFIGSRTSSTYISISKNGVELSNSTGVNGKTAPAIEAYIGTRNINGAPGEFSTKECAGAFIGNGLTVAQITAKHTALQTMNTSLSRQV